MAQHGVTAKMIQTALNKGKLLWDPKNNVVNYVLEEGFASGQSLLVGKNPITGTITTVMRGNRLMRRRFIPIE